MTQPDTKERLLDAAERLFSDQGLSAASLRAITAAAGVNLAAVNYHFGSKEGLIQAVLARRLEPLNRQRLEELDRLQAEAGGEAVSLEEIIRAFLRPALRLAADPDWGSFCSRLLGRLHTESDPAIRDIFVEQFREVADRFIPAFAAACPQLPPAELLWRVHFLAGSMAHTMADLFDLRKFSDGLCDPRDVEATTEQQVQYAAAGFRAPVPKSGTEKKR